VTVPADELWVIRHGETEWSRDGRHTSRTEIELTPEGEEVARGLARGREGVEFVLVLTSPVQAQEASELKALAARPEPILRLLGGLRVDFDRGHVEDCRRHL